MTKKIKVTKKREPACFIVGMQINVSCRPPTRTNYICICKLPEGFSHHCLGVRFFSIFIVQVHCFIFQNNAAWSKCVVRTSQNIQDHLLSSSDRTNICNGRHQANLLLLAVMERIVRIMLFRAKIESWVEAYEDFIGIKAVKEAQAGVMMVCVTTEVLG